MKFGSKKVWYGLLLLWVCIQFTQQWIGNKANLLGLRGCYIVYSSEAGSRFPVRIEEIKGKDEKFSNGLFSFEAFHNLPAKGEGKAVTAEGIFTNQNLFSIYSYPLVDGLFWTEETAYPAVVINEGLAWQLFGTAYAAGMKMELLDREFTIAGVVKQKEVGKPYQIWIPHSFAQPEYQVSTFSFLSYRQNQLTSYLEIKEFMEVQFQETMAFDILDINQYRNSFLLRSQLGLVAGCISVAVVALYLGRRAWKSGAIILKDLCWYGFLFAFFLGMSIKIGQCIFKSFWFPVEQGFIKNIFILFTNYGINGDLGYCFPLNQLFIYNGWCNLFTACSILLSFALCFVYLYGNVTETAPEQKNAKKMVG